jgi:CubicO group peptidase (beta-lactamase class C family)
VPGLALAVVADGEVLDARGYGYADLEQKRPVTPDTTFAIGSCTKAFTTTALAMLVERGALDWDRPVRDYLPGFRMLDEVVGARVTARDLACHRTGLPSHDPVWYGAGVSRHELVKRLAYLAPTRDFRSAYQYNNLMYIAAGVLVEAISGMTWEDFTRRRILEPLGMHRSSFSPARALALGGLALPYMERDGRAVGFRSWPGEDALSAAGWIHSASWRCPPGFACIWPVAPLPAWASSSPRIAWLRRTPRRSSHRSRRQCSAPIPNLRT